MNWLISKILTYVKLKLHELIGTSWAILIRRILTCIVHLGHWDFLVMFRRLLILLGEQWF
jgi:hypothetical protein